MSLICTPRIAGRIPPGVTFLPDDDHLPRSQRRLWLDLDIEDHAAVEEAFRRDDLVDVTDLRSGLTFRVRRAECGLGCRCAALAEWVNRTGGFDADVL